MNFDNLLTRVLTLALLGMLLIGCPGGGGGGDDADDDTPDDTPVTADNELPIKIDEQVNIPYVSVKVCVPGDPENCKTIDNILLDTGSSGLRIMKSALSSVFTQKLTPHENDTGDQLAQCMQFADGYSWGPLYKADVSFAKETVNGLVFQVIDGASLNIPASCSSTGAAQNTPETFGANGVLGLGHAARDCGEQCVDFAYNLYYRCPTNNCTETRIDLEDQVHNPAVFFPVHNNGVVIVLPSIPAAGRSTVNGSAYFGIGTADNNQLGDATVLTVDEYGLFTTEYKSLIFEESFIDSGSNGLYFEDEEIPLCTGQLEGFYCPATELQLSARLSSAPGTPNAGVSETIDFSIANTAALDTRNAAHRNLGGTVPATLAGMFDWGLPFFYGRTVFTAFDDANTNGGVGPYVAF